MSGKQDDAGISQTYRDHRPYLVDLAFRMLGDLGAAEDVVQDAFARLLHADSGQIEDERGWLIVVTSRLALDQIRSARSRRERAHDPGDIEFAAPRAQPALADPADRITFDDSVRLALLVMLQNLSPAERVVFVLHDVFRMPFDVIAETIGRPAATCRQLAKRARQRVADGRPGTRFDVESAEHRLVTDKFIAACAGGDLDGLMAVLAPAAWGAIDLGPAAEPRMIVTGAENVAANLLRFWGPGSTLVSHPVGGQPALLGFHGRALAALLLLRVRRQQVESVHVIADPAQIGFLSRQLAAYTSSLPAAEISDTSGKE
jgi:RNA polymerase sigma-70 factor, ECF subfamily